MRVLNYKKLGLVLFAVLFAAMQTVMSQNTERAAEFQGGQEALNQFLQKNISLQVMQEAGIGGRVIVSFTITTQGDITDIKVFRSVHSLLDCEAVRLIASMPNWTPAIAANGRPIKTTFHIPINFNLVGEAKNNLTTIEKPYNEIATLDCAYNSKTANNIAKRRLGIQLGTHYFNQSIYDKAFAYLPYNDSTTIQFVEQLKKQGDYDKVLEYLKLQQAKQGNEVAKSNLQKQYSSIKIKVVKEEIKNAWPKYSFINSYTGQTIGNTKWDTYKETPNGYICTRGNYSYNITNFISFDGEISKEYKSISDFFNGSAVVKSHNGKIGIIDDTGKEIVPLIYDINITDVAHPEIIVLKKDDQNFFFKNGNRIFSEYEIVDFNMTDFFANGNLIAKQHEKYGIIDKLGNIVVPFNYVLIKRLPTISYNKEKYNLSLLPAKAENGKWGYINIKTGNIDIPCTYDVDDADFWAVENTYHSGIDIGEGNAIVAKNGNTYAMNKQGQKIGLSVEEQRAKVERERQEAIARAEAKRQNAIKSAQIGDKLLYSESWSYREGFWIFTTEGSYTMMVTCFVERIEGDRYQLRVGDVKSSNSERYSSPTINGVRVSKGDLIWARPLKDTQWVYGE